MILYLQKVKEEKEMKVTIEFEGRIYMRQYFTDKVRFNVHNPEGTYGEGEWIYREFNGEDGRDQGETGIAKEQVINDKEQVIA